MALTLALTRPLLESGVQDHLDLIQHCRILSPARLRVILPSVGSEVPWEFDR